jgi:hypothetical protein
MIFPKQASAFLVTYPVINAINKEGNETERAVAWEKAFIQLAKVYLLSCVIPIIAYFLCYCSWFPVFQLESRHFYLFKV